MYEYTDKTLKHLQKFYIRQFGKLKTVLQFDEINRLQKSVNDTFEKCYKETRKCYRDIARHYYEEEGGEDDYINYLWVDKFLKRFDPITQYMFVSEYDRKRSRAFEALVATPSNKEVDRIIRILYRQTKQWADEITDEARLEAFKDEAVEQVRWKSETDSRVCSICYSRNNRIYPIKSVPPKPHINCRCWLEKI